MAANPGGSSFVGPAITAAMLESVADPTDFPPQSVAPGLRTLDSTFRCTICGEVFDGPVSIKCGHSFCSGCIRNAFQQKLECPTCRKPTNEDHIRPNSVLEEAITAWNESRTYVLALIKQQEGRDSALREASRRPRKRRRAGSDSSIEMLDIAPAGPSSPRKPQSEATVCARKATAMAKNVLNQEADSDGITTTLNPQLNSVVPCPLCGGNVEYRDLNAHMDRQCKDPPKPKETASSAWSKLMANPGTKKKKGKQRQSQSDTDEDERLPKKSYDTLKEKQLKDLLREYGLSTQGDRLVLRRRHERWTMMYNSNLDRSLPNRKSKALLRQELKHWEESLSKRKKPTVDPKEHAKVHSSEFSRLVLLAKGGVHRSKDSNPSNATPPLQSPSTEVVTPTFVPNSLLLPEKEGPFANNSEDAIEID